jgi:hypothetical protein
MKTATKLLNELIDRKVRASHVISNDGETAIFAIDGVQYEMCCKITDIESFLTAFPAGHQVPPSTMLVLIVSKGYCREEADPIREMYWKVRTCWMCHNNDATMEREGNTGMAPVCSRCAAAIEAGYDFDDDHWSCTCDDCIGMPFPSKSLPVEGLSELD